MRRLASAAHFLSLLVLISACATSPGGIGRSLAGSAGPVAWEIADVGQLRSSDGMGLRWSYAIVLRERAGSTIQFERVERGAYASGIEVIGAPLRSWPFQRTLGPNSEIRYATTDSWGYVSPTQPAFGGAATIQPITVEYRFIGRDSAGGTVSVPVRVQLDQGVGKLVTVRSATGPLPPPAALGESDLPTLAGTWRGSYRADGGVFDIPIEAVIQPTGAIEMRENDPVSTWYPGDRVHP
jgi:hypothetical protein